MGRIQFVDEESKRIIASALIDRDILVGINNIRSHTMTKARSMQIHESLELN